MHIAGGGGGYAGSTNWYSQDVEQMWAKLANQDTNSHWQRVTQWQKTYELSSTHLSRLKIYRDRLTEAWPPEKNEAARAYVERLDHLILTVQGIYDAAVANYQTVKNVALAISDAKPKLKKIYDDYVAKKAAKKEYDERVAAEKDSMLPGTTLGDPPATQADLDKLNNQARSIMYNLSNELGLAQMQIRKPPEYKPKAGNQTGGGDDEAGGGGGGGLSGSPPVLPAVVPVSPGGGGSTPRPPSAPPPQVVPPVAPAPGGPILGGTGPLAPPVQPAPPPVITPSPAPTPTPGLPPVPPPVVGLPPGSGYPLPSHTPPGGVPKPGLTPTAGLPPRAMPPGGLIGGSPGTGLGQPAPGVGAARRINPVGGVIGGGGGGGAGSPRTVPPTAPLGGGGQRPGAGQRPGVGLGRSGQPFGMVPGARGAGRTRDEEHNGQHWDPDNPWETDEGVAPVMLPSRETGRIDPGPAIGYNR